MILWGWILARSHHTTVNHITAAGSGLFLASACIQVCPPTARCSDCGVSWCRRTDQFITPLYSPCAPRKETRTEGNKHAWRSPRLGHICIKPLTNPGLINVEGKNNSCFCATCKHPSTWLHLHSCGNCRRTKTRRKLQFGASAVYTLKFRISLLPLHDQQGSSSFWFTSNFKPFRAFQWKKVSWFQGWFFQGEPWPRHWMRH